MSAHTPGPWAYSRLSDYTGELSVYCAAPGANRNTVARVRCLDGGEVLPREANAALIAAAPDLLTQCKRALDAWTGDGPEVLLDDLRAAINKATGSAA